MSIHDKIRDAKLTLLDMHYAAKVGHVGGNMSCIDILMTLFHEVMGDFDEFVLSKGHSAGALYVTLASKGLIPAEELATFHKDGTRLPGHPAPRTFVPFATGSLGHGLSLAAGMALAKKLAGAPGRVYCVLSDGECSEGSTLEGFNFAQQHNLPLTAIIDYNGWQGFKSVQEHELPWFALNYDDVYGELITVDGHDPVEIKARCSSALGFDWFVAKTVKGHGIPGFEDTLESHYKPLTETQYEAARGVICQT